MAGVASEWAHLSGGHLFCAPLGAMDAPPGALRVSRRLEDSAMGRAAAQRLEDAARRHGDTIRQRHRPWERPAGP